MKTQQVWELYADDLKRFIFSKVKDGAMSDDLLQEVFIKIHTKIGTLQNTDKLKSWVFSIARYTVVDYFRQKPKADEVPNEDFVFQEINQEHSEQDCLRGIIRNLPKKYRTPLFLSDIKGMKQSEVAKELQVSLPAVKSQIQRARKLISKGFMDCCDFKMNASGHLVGELKDKADCKICH